MAGIGLGSIGGRVHRWLGLASTWLLIPIALSGLALVWQGPLERLTAPERYRISGETRLSAEAYAAAAHRALAPGERVAGLTLQQGSDPVIATLRTPDAQRRLFLDPPTARVLGVARDDDRLARFHARLGVPGIGAWLFGVAGMVLAVSVLTGLWTWATHRPAKKGKRAKAASRVTTLHRRTGPWAALPILAIASSGVALAFPILAAGEASWRAEPAAMPVARTTLSVTRAVASARRWSPGPLVGVDWPGVKAPDWTVRFGGDRPMTVKVADDSISAVSVPAREEPVIASWARRLHAGADGSWVWRLFASVAGLLVLWQAATGLIGGVRRARR